MKPNFKVKKGVKHFPNWAPIADDEPMKDGDRFVGFAGVNSEYDCPEKGYKIQTGCHYVGVSMQQEWGIGSSVLRQNRVYRFCPGFFPDDCDMFTSRSSPIPLNCIYSEALPLP